MEKIENTTEITRLQKRINILLWVLCIIVFLALSSNWYALICAMKVKENFKKEKTKTYNSMHGIPEIEKP